MFDIGLHVDPSTLHLTEREAQIRHMVLWACVFCDKWWSLYLGRPTAIKTTDIAPACLKQDFGPLILTRITGQEKEPVTKVYEALLRLMELVGPLCELDVRKSSRSSEGYFTVAAVNRELDKWYAGLPGELKWSDKNCETMPPSFFLLQ